MKIDRYPGVNPFSGNEQVVFFGRDYDIESLYNIVRVEKIAVLYGKSGYGKTSLINAGLLPRLGPSYKFLRIRFGEYIEGQSLGPVDLVEQLVADKFPTNPDFDFLDAPGFPNSLWMKIKRRSNPSATRTAHDEWEEPVNETLLLVFDQFEEFFSYPADQQQWLKIQLQELLADHAPETTRDAMRNLTREQKSLMAVPLEIHLLFAIRSDRISELDRFKDRLPGILLKRYELKPLSRDQAKDAVVLPAQLDFQDNNIEFNTPPFDFTHEALERLLDALSSSKAANGKGIEAFQLQILCGTIEDNIRAGLIQDGDGNGRPEIDTDDLPDFETVFSSYYESCLREIEDSERETARAVVEDGLVRFDPVSGEGRRLSVDGGALLQQFAHKGLTTHLLNQLENAFLVRRDPNTLGGFNYELCHDSLLKPIAKSISDRRDKETKAKQEEEIKRARADEAAKQEKKNSERIKKYFGFLKGLSLALLIAALIALYFWGSSVKDRKAAEYSAQQAISGTNLAVSVIQDDKTLALQIFWYTASNMKTAGKIQDVGQDQLERGDIGYYKNVFDGHSGDVLTGALSPDGKQVLTAEWNGTIRIWDLENDHVPALEFSHGAEAVEVALFTPDGLKIITAGRDGKVLFWNRKGEKLDSLVIPSKIDILSGKLTRDGRLLVLGTRRPDILVYDLKSKKLEKLTREAGKEGKVPGGTLSLDISRDDRYVVAGSWDKKARVWNLKSKKQVHTMSHKSSVRAVAFSPDGRSILTGCAEKGAFLWDFIASDPGSSPQIYKTLLAGFSGGIRAVAFSNDGNYLLTGGEDAAIRLWDSDGRPEREFWGHKDILEFVTLTPDGQYILSGSRDKTARLWHFSNRIFPAQKHEEEINTVSISSDGKRLLTGGRDKIANEWSESGQLLYSFKEHDGNVTSSAWAPGNNGMITGSWDGRAIYRDQNENRTLILKHDGAVHSVAFYQEDKDSSIRLLTAGADNVAKLWTINSGREDVVFRGHKAPVMAVASIPGSAVITGSQDKTAIVWDMNGKLRRRLQGHTDDVIAVAASPDGSYLLTGSRDQTARIWRRKNGESLHILRHRGAVSGVAFSPDNIHILTSSADGMVRYWNIEGMQIDSFEFDDDVTSVCFFPDGKSFVAGCKNKTAVRWSLTNHEKMNTYEGANSVSSFFKKVDDLFNQGVLYKHPLRELHEAGVILQQKDLKLVYQSMKIYELLDEYNGRLEDINIANAIKEKLDMDTSTSDIKQFLANYRDFIRNKDEISLDFFETGIKRLVELEDNIENRKLAARYYNAIAWNNIVVRRKYEDADRCLKQALAMDEKYKNIYTNIPAVQLLKGNVKKAKTLYERYKKEKYDPPGTPTYADAFLEDIQEFEDRKMIPPSLKKHVEAIKKMLNEKD